MARVTSPGDEDPAETPERPEVAAWGALLEGLRSAGEAVAESTAGLDPVEQADGFRALVRALHNQLARFEVDRDRPELVPFNGWRQKFFMDNPDFRYWVADVRDDRRYVITGNRGAAAFVSITAYAGAGPTKAGASARIDADDLAFDVGGGFRVVVGGDQPAQGDWLPLPEGANALWVRHFHDDVRTDALGWCEIAPLDPVAPPPPIDPGRFAHQLRRLGSTMAFVPSVLDHAAAADLAQVNQLRHWSEMTGGAVYTEPGIHYVRGGWQLGPGEGLEVEGELVPCRYWNVLLHSRFLNSLDHRHRTVSRTGPSITERDGRFRLLLAAVDPGSAGHDWLDTEGRPFGIVVLRWLHAERGPGVPTTRVVRLADVR
jgi:hypothetical protein